MARQRSADALSVTGITELSRSLKAVKPELAKELGRTNKSIAEFVAADARAAAYALGGVAAKTAPSLKPRGGAGFAGVALGGPAYPFALGAEFGSGREKERGRKSGFYIGYRQFSEWRGNSTGAGYFLYPAIRDDGQRIKAAYTDGLEEIIRKAGLET